MESAVPHTTETPRELGYRWPAEWEPHAATWLTWPHNPDTWPGRLPLAQAEFAQFVRTLARFERVELLLSNDAVREQAAVELRGVANVVTHFRTTNDSWMRDYGPTFLRHSVSGQPALVDWQYNAWGGKYPPWDDDNRVPAWIAELRGCRRFAVDRVLEGGAIEGNGQGLVLTTEDCLLNPNRNAGATRESMELLLREYLAVDEVCWLLGRGIDGDDTDGHIDQLARFVDAATVVAPWSEDASDPQAAPLGENLRRLEQFRTAAGSRLNVVRLPMPAARFCQGQRLPCSYCNFYIANGVVLVPQFDDPHDARALGILGELFPDREVVGASALELVWGLGAFHCLTQQEPA